MWNRPEDVDLHHEVTQLLNPEAVEHFLTRPMLAGRSRNGAHAEDPSIMQDLLQRIQMNWERRPRQQPRA